MLQATSLFFTFLVGVQVSLVEHTSYPKGIISSQNGVYTLSCSYHPAFEVSIDQAVLRKDGQAVWHKQGAGESHFFLGNLGTTVAMIPEGDPVRLDFYDGQGRRAGTVRVPFTQGAQFSDDGEHFFIVSGTGGLLQFAKDGETEAQFGPANAFAISGDGRTVALVQGSELSIFRSQKLLLRAALPRANVRSMTLSRDGKTLGVIDQGTLLVFDTRAKKELSRVRLANPIVLGVAPDGEQVVCAQEERRATSLVRFSLFSRTGAKTAEWSKQFEREYETVHRIDCRSNGIIDVYTTDGRDRYFVSGKED